MATSAERQRRFREGKQRAGKAQVNLYLSRPAVEELDRRKTKEGTRDEVVESLLKPITSDKVKEGSFGRVPTKKRAPTEYVAKFVRENVPKGCWGFAEQWLLEQTDKFKKEVVAQVEKNTAMQRKELEQERTHISEMMAEAAEKRQFYYDLLNKRANGHDFRKGLKVLRQMAHPDRSETTASLKAKAMHEIEALAQFLGV